MPAGHAEHTVPLGERPVGHVATQAAVLGTRYVALGQVWHWLAAPPLQVAHDASHGWHTLAASAYRPPEHALTQTVPLR